MIFDGASKLIILEAADGDAIDVIDIYSRWKDWVLAGHAQYTSAMSSLGGDPTITGQFLGRTFFMENGWKIRPRSEDHELQLAGNLFSRDGLNPIIAAVGTHQVLVTVVRSNLVDLLGGGASPDEVWSHQRALTVGKYIALKDA